jgi:hypothetical protein
MNREELQQVLERAGVKPRFYSLFGPALHSESYSIVEDSDSFKVLYKERGEFTDVESGLTEDGACQLVVSLLRDENLLPRR